jgi:hypothetical protein
MVTAVSSSPLCEEHLIDAWYQACRRIDDLPAKAHKRLWFEDPAVIAALPTNPLPPPPPAPPRQGHVYFIRFGQRVKIGFTTNWRRRLSALPYDEILALMPGTMLDEKRCHAAFAHLRDVGEWFRVAPDLLAFVASLSQESVDTG